MGNYEQAISLFDRAIAQDPTDIASMNSKGKTLIKAGQIEAAVLCFQNIISLNWKLPEVYCNLGVALHQLDRVHDARDAYQTALKLKKGYFEPLRNMAILLRDQGDIDGSINAFEQLISGYPEQVDLHFDLACSLLLKGDYARGWQEYEWRWISTNTTKPKLKGKEWRGEPLSNKTILIYCEQSAGDAIQFSRFIPMLAAQGLKTILQCPDTLIPLFSHMKGVDQVISVNQKAKGYDVHCPIMSLPLYLGITLDNLPARTPYLSHDYRPVNELQLSKEKYHIGVAWAGSTMHSIDSKHSCNVELFRSLTDIDRVQLHSLQKLDKDATTPDFMVDYSELLTNYGNTAALINKLDLVITVDTSVAHLAGALGKPVWLLLAHAPNWSWLQKGESSPWYPTAKLIRQISPGDWRGIFAEIRNTLSMQLGGNKLVSEQQTESSYELNSAIYSDGFNQIAKCRHGMMIFNKHDAYVGRSLKLYGEFSEGEIEVFDRYISPGHTVVEVGANIGAHTVYLSKRVGTQGSVIAIEPQRLVFQTLCANLAINNLTNVITYQAGAGSADGVITVPNVDPNEPHNFGGVSLGGSEGYLVPLMTIDSLNMTHCNLLKLDVEGMEIEVIKGAIETIERCKPIMYIENDRRENSSELVKMINTLGYQLWWHQPPLFDQNNFANNTNNVFGNIVSLNILCLPKGMQMDFDLQPVVDPEMPWQ